MVRAPFCRLADLRRVLDARRAARQAAAEAGYQRLLKEKIGGIRRRPGRGGRRPS